MNDKPVTRIDLENTGEAVIIRQWKEGWNEGDKADLETIEPGAYIVGLLMRYEKQGFTCEMCDALHGRALRGKTARVDFIKAGESWRVRKYPVGWTAKTKPISDGLKSDAEAKEAMLWCKTHGWTVREWPGGARAFRGLPLPVRDSGSIRVMRRKVEQDMAIGHSSADNRSQFDFAFDF